MSNQMKPFSGIPPLARSHATVPPLATPRLNWLNASSHPACHTIRNLRREITESRRHGPNEFKMYVKTVAVRGSFPLSQNCGHKRDGATTRSMWGCRMTSRPLQCPSWKARVEHPCSLDAGPWGSSGFRPSKIPQNFQLPGCGPVLLKPRTSAGAGRVQGSLHFPFDAVQQNKTRSKLARKVRLRDLGKRGLGILQSETQGCSPFQHHMSNTMKIGHIDQ